MTVEESPRPRGRPRRFEVEHALATAQSLFHAHGYDAVGVAAITAALGIGPPSFYAAFGSKAALFGRVLDRYARSALPMDALLRPGRPPAEALAALLETAARTYAADPRAGGCLVLEAVRAGGEAECAVLARRVRDQGRERLRAFVAATHPAEADAVVDYVVSTLSGLSAGAREGWGAERLVAVARAAAVALDPSLAGSAGTRFRATP